MAIKLSTLALLLGGFMALFNAYGVAKPAAFAAAARKFPRSIPIGWVLTLGAATWFIFNLSQENISDFEPLKPYLYALFAFVGIGTCLYVNDFLAARGLAVVILLLAKLMVDTARWTDTPWRLVIVAWAYVFVIAGMWLTVSPWRLRDLIAWCTLNDSRTRLLSALRCAFGLFVVALGLTVF
jgi:hypothetical protein